MKVWYKILIGTFEADEGFCFCLFAAGFFAGESVGGRFRAPGGAVESFEAEGLCLFTGLARGFLLDWSLSAAFRALKATLITS